MILKTQAPPQDPIAAVTHPDPYPYYAMLVADKPIYRDAQLGLWVASSAETVTSVLISDLCRVRPPREPIPKALLGSPAADIFRYLVRMNDGEGHSPFKNVVSASLESLDMARVEERGRHWAGLLVETIKPQQDPDRLMDFAFQLPVYILADLLDVPQDELPQVAAWTSDFVACLSPISQVEQIERGKIAAGRLLELFRPLLINQQAGRSEGLLSTLSHEAKRVGRGDEDVIIANSIGFLSQAYEATAGLMGNTLLTFASHRRVREQVLADPDLLRHIIHEVLRFDSPVQNTRRFVVKGGILAGQDMKEGDAILVLLAAADRDPLANPDPERFDIFRPDRRIFTFGVGIHACPGETLAVTIAQAGLEQLLASGLDLEQLAGAVTYRPSINVRIPMWIK
jgi:cytochrome P450